MTESEAMIRLDFIRCALLGGTKPEIISNEDNVELMDNAIKALEDVQQYRAIGKPKDKCTCPSCGTHNEVFKKRRNTVAHDIVYCWHCGQAVEIDRLEE